MEKNTDELIAWAAGLFEGDGCATSHLQRKRARLQPELAVYQAGRAQAPEMLIRFRGIVDCGTLLGPARGRLWCWRAGRMSDVVQVATLLWPWLGPAKRHQLLAVSGRVSDGGLHAALVELPQGKAFEEGRAPRSVDLAWAGGFFAGEGWFGCRGPVPSSRWPQLRAAITQAGPDEVPVALRRFRAAVGGLGSITGPYLRTSPWSRQPQYRWSVGSANGVRSVIEQLWPWLDESKRAQARLAVAMFDDLTLKRSARPRV